MTATMMEPMDVRSQHNPFMMDPGLAPNRTVPILAPSMLQSPPHLNQSNPSPPAQMMAPPTRTSPDGETNGVQEQVPSSDAQSNNVNGNANEPNAAAAAAASGSAQQPKVVQTAFIHKLYNMLGDQSIQHLISWSQSGDSFVMSPSNDFSKVLSQYFKHTNISSFVRQLNMYGFHKVSDVFHGNSPDAPLWEFKHGGGNFRRGDMVGLREIKRRASRHALVHRNESYTASKPPMPTQVGPPEPMPQHSMQNMQNMQSLQESTDSRLLNLEHTMWDMHGRLARNEESTQILQIRNQVAIDALARAFQLHQELSRLTLSLVSNPENPICRDIINVQAEAQRNFDMIRSMEESSDAPFSAGRPYFSGLSLDNPPVSPRQMPQDVRNPTINIQRQPYQRVSVANQGHLASNQRRPYGSIGSNMGSSPNSSRQLVPPPPPMPQHLTSTSSPPNNIPRRHTSADIRNAPGWQQQTSPYGSGNNSTQWPSSPRLNGMSEEQHIRDSFSGYSMGNTTSGRRDSLRPVSPPFGSGGVGPADSLSTWSWGTRDKGVNGMLKDTSGPPTRRGSMAHILNPAETAERAEEHDEDALREEDRKRKRLQ